MILHNKIFLAYLNKISCFCKQIMLPSNHKVKNPMIEVEMTDGVEKMNLMSLDKDIEDTIHQIILACGIRPLKEKVTLLFLTIDYIFEHNKELMPLFTDDVTLH